MSVALLVRRRCPKGQRSHDRWLVRKVAGRRFLFVLDDAPVHSLVFRRDAVAKLGKVAAEARIGQRRVLHQGQPLRKPVQPLVCGRACAFAHRVHVESHHLAEPRADFARFVNDGRRDSALLREGDAVAGLDGRGPLRDSPEKVDREHAGLRISVFGPLGKLRLQMDVLHVRVDFGEMRKLMVVRDEERVRRRRRQGLAHGPRNRQAFEVRRAPSQLVDQDQGALRQIAQDVGRVPHLHVEGADAVLHVVCGAHPREDAVAHGDDAVLGRDPSAGLRHDHDHCNLLHQRRLAGSVRARDDLEVHEGARQHIRGHERRQAVAVRDRMLPSLDHQRSLLGELGPAVGRSLRHGKVCEAHEHVQQRDCVNHGEQGVHGVRQKQHLLRRLAHAARKALDGGSRARDRLPVSHLPYEDARKRLTRALQGDHQVEALVGRELDRDHKLMLGAQRLGGAVYVLHGLQQGFPRDVQHAVVPRLYREARSVELLVRLPSVAGGRRKQLGQLALHELQIFVLHRTDDRLEQGRSRRARSELRHQQGQELQRVIQSQKRRDRGLRRFHRDVGGDPAQAIDDAIQVRQLRQLFQQDLQELFVFDDLLHHVLACLNGRDITRRTQQTCPEFLSADARFRVVQLAEER
eukprot:scaffold3867_cov254-Pinguiococcus_pyrenoidosus.AAC.7